MVHVRMYAALVARESERRREAPAAATAPTGPSVTVGHRPVAPNPPEAAQGGGLTVPPPLGGFGRWQSTFLAFVGYTPTIVRSWVMLGPLSGRFSGAQGTRRRRTQNAIPLLEAESPLHEAELPLGPSRTRTVRLPVGRSEADVSGSQQEAWSC